MDGTGKPNFTRLRLCSTELIKLVSQVAIVIFPARSAPGAAAFTPKGRVLLSPPIAPAERR